MSWAPHVAALRAGSVIACPTETLYGLLADARSAEAVARVIAIKQRGDAPIGLLAPDLATVLAQCVLNERARELARRHWPGPLSLVVRVRDKHQLAPGIVHRGTVSIRVPGPSAALELAQLFGNVLTATSCNPTGQPAAETPEQVKAYFASEVVVVPGYASGLASTIVDATGEEPKILRQGAIEL
ncbi:MAG TPA: L-threonylcarbamoyladenylate synthase [Polyangiales bacterium]|nr:L-threonylcarbamoyladenylate synthase [Polyangiales bacterium]